MAQNYTPQQQKWTTDFQALVLQLIAIDDAFDASIDEYTNQQFGNGGINALTDAVVQGVIPQATALQVWGAEGAVVAIRATIASNRGYLDAIKP